MRRMRRHRRACTVAALFALVGSHDGARRRLAAPDPFASLCRAPCAFHEFSPATTNISKDDIAAYQSTGVQEIVNAFIRRRNILKGRTVLENGCDITGRTGVFFQQMSEANYVGVNCGFNSKFPSTLVASNARTRFLATNCTVLPFRDGVIDKVFSDNVVEHVRNLKQYIGETYRVLKPGGAALFKFYPTWDTPRGHHVHDGMVASWAKASCGTRATTNYKNDGTFIPDGAHLSWPREKLAAQLRAKLASTCRDEMVTQIVRYIYDGHGINKRPRQEIVRLLTEDLPWAKVVDNSAGKGHRIYLRKEAG